MKELCRILIVDDEYILRQGIKHLLNWEKEGFEIIGEASNGEEALGLIEKLKPHIIISDVVMPVMDGVDLAKIIKSRYPELQMVILSGYSDFDYVKNTFKYGVNDYILKPKLDPNELLSLLKDTASNILNLSLSPSDDDSTLNINSILSKLVSGFSVDYDSNTINNLFDKDSFMLIAFDLKTLEASNKLASLNLTLTLSNAAKLTLNTSYYYEINLNNDFFLLLINYESKNNHTILQQINSLLSETSTKVHQSFAVISKAFSSIYRLPEVYNDEIKPLFGYRFYFKNETLISNDNLPVINTSDKFDYKYYSDQIYMLNISTALNYLKDQVQHIIHSCSLNEFELKTLTQNALYNIINILDELGFTLEEMSSLKRSYFHKIDEARFSEDLVELLNKISEEIIELLSQHQSSMNDQIINKIIEYISKHYDEQLSLKELADKFHFNYYYLSSYFSSHNSEGFSEYLNKVRVEKAAELLRNEAIPVSEICYKVGYSDHSYFCKVFKKFKKLTPSKFRKNILNNKRGSFV
ncbi:response regulator [Clostridium sp. C8-1-8]|uniref:response regulator n=1 Tax=Clostridium sp. C8-1-8 TaxID=2698831 RepID=UPI00136E47E0|nr:response regulator [Clostridium sp. C8-1-8]